MYHDISPACWWPFYPKFEDVFILLELFFFRAAFGNNNSYMRKGSKPFLILLIGRPSLLILEGKDSHRLVHLSVEDLRNQLPNKGLTSPNISLSCWLLGFSFAHLIFWPPHSFADWQLSGAALNSPIWCLYLVLLVYLCKEPLACNHQDLINFVLKYDLSLTSKYLQSSNIPEDITRPAGSPWLEGLLGKHLRWQRDQKRKQGS